MLGAQCHAVRVRLTGPPVPEGTLAERLAAAGPWRLWVEDVPAGAAEPFAARRLDAEMRRPHGRMCGVSSCGTTTGRPTWWSWRTGTGWTGAGCAP